VVVGRSIAVELSEPAWLLLLLLVGGLLAGYLVLLARRRRDTVRFTALELLDRIAPQRPGWTRHVPTAALLVALVLLVVGLAGPTAEGRVPRNRATIVMVIDVSLSMQATDVQPSRLLAAQAAARSFIQELPPTINLGLVAFAGTAAVLVPPTTDRAVVDRAIGTLKLAESTATGEGIFAALQSIDTFTAAIPGSEEGPPPAHIVLMSDGKQTVPGGVDPENEPRGAFTAARAAAERKIPVSAIAFGTDYGTIELNPGERSPVPIDAAAMREIANISGGRAFSASSEGELRQIYEQLREQIGYETRKVDVSKPWFAGGTLVTMLGLGSALAFGRRIP
jgi:Ca-activated chloride channel family protein